MRAQPKTSRPVSEGFTLVELLMAMLIMTVGLLGLLQAVGVAYEHNARNRLREEAVEVAEEGMNDFRRMAFDAITTVNAITPITRSIGSVRQQFTLTRDSRPMGTTSKRLRVAVGWVFKQVSSSHELYTIKSK